MTDLKNADPLPPPRDVQGTSTGGWMTALGDMLRNRDREGLGSPEGVVSAKIGTLYRRRDGGAGTSLYVKESDDGGNTGWSAK